MKRSQAMKYGATLAGAIGTALFGFCGTAQAVDVDPGDYTALPAGTTLAMIYGTYTGRDELQVSNGPTVANNTTLDSEIGLARFVHYTKLGPFTVDPQIIIPFGSLNNGKVDGQRLNNAGGIGDIIPFATIWLVNKPSPTHTTFFGISPIVTIPTGQYDHTKSVNLGGNRFVYDLQAGLIQGFGKHVTIDAIADEIWYGNNTDYGVAHQTLRQSSTTSMQVWARYGLSPQTTVAAGYAGYWGGNQRVETAFDGTKTENQQVRLSIQSFVTKSVQLELIGGHMVHVEGGFREAERIQVRVLKVL